LRSDTGNAAMERRKAKPPWPAVYPLRESDAPRRFARVSPRKDGNVFGSRRDLHPPGAFTWNEDDEAIVEMELVEE
jgi:hypothetical protein